jgi:outer membrane protein TolC
MRWKAVVMGLALTLAAAAGCGQKFFLDKETYETSLAGLQLPFNPETDPFATIKPITPLVKTPATVNNATRTPRHISLAECIARSLETGSVGVQSVRVLGVANDDLVSFSGVSAVGSDSIRVFALNPAIAYNEIERNLSRFDAQLQSSMTWNSQDQPPGSANAFNNGEFAAFSSTLAKPLPSGGLASITFDTNYNNLNNVNPVLGTRITPLSYTADLKLHLDQPLLQGAGVFINQLRPAHPDEGTGILGPRAGLVGSDGILISRLRFDQSRAEFERLVHFMLLNVETAYWNLYGAYVNLFTAEQVLRQSHEAWRFTQDKVNVGKLGRASLQETIGQYQQFRGARLQALGQVLEAERVLRALIGLPGEDGTQLVPIDAPTLARYQPDWDSALQDALNLRPELVIARQDVKTNQLALIRDKNLLLPDLRLISEYNLHGLGSRLDGNGTFGGASPFTGNTTNAFRSLASDHFSDYTIGLQLNVPIGYRAAHAFVRTSRLRLAQSYAVLKDQEEKAERFLVNAYRTIQEKYATIEAFRAQRMASGEELKILNIKIKAGQIDATTRGTANDPSSSLLEVQKLWANALQSEYQAIVDYNNSLAKFEFAKGTIMRHNNVVINEGPLPECAQVRAVENERQRSLALVHRERANPIAYSSCGTCGDKNACGVPMLPRDSAPSLPALFEKAPPVPEKLEMPASTASQPVTSAPVAPLSVGVPTTIPASPYTPAAPLSVGVPPTSPASPYAPAAPSMMGGPPTQPPGTLPLALPVGKMTR